MKHAFLMGLIFLMISLQPAWAQDKDDDLKPEETRHLEASDTTATDAEQQNPQAAAEIRQFLAMHIAHANAKDVEAYMGDFDAKQLKHVDDLREYTMRAMALNALKIELLAVEFAQIQEKAATVHTRQRSGYINDSGQNVVDDVILSYRLVRDDNHAWKILFTERRRLSAP